jgi:thioredoxin reductase (NADPH)
MNMNKDVLIIGGGPAGMAAAIWCQRLGIDHLLIEKNEKLGGQLFHIHNKVIDYPGVLANNGKDIQQSFVSHLEDLGCQFLVSTSIERLDMNEKRALVNHQGKKYSITFQYLIAATGSSPKRLDVPGEKEMIERKEVYSATKDASKFNNKRVAVIGGGDRAFEGALILAEHGAFVYLIHRSTRFRARDEYVKPVLNHSNIVLLTNTVITKIIGKHHVTAVEVMTNDQKKLLEVDGVFIRIGGKPNSELISSFVKTDLDGYVIVDEHCRTSHENIFAIGDVCMRPLYSSIVTSASHGMIAAKHISLLMKDNQNH